MSPVPSESESNVEKIQVNHQSDVPIYRQIVAQLSFMIEMGDLQPGQKLPSARLLADNLHINRNTVARAYSDLGKLGLVQAHGRSGTAVIGPGPTSEISDSRERARAILEAAARECIDLGLSAADIQALVMGLAVRAEEEVIKVSFVECNSDRAKYFANELETNLGLKVRPLVLGEFEPASERADLFLTTFFHLAEVRTLMRGHGTEVVAIVVAPHIQTLMAIASVPRSRTVGIWYTTEEQAVSIRDSLAQSGFQNIRILHSASSEELDGTDMVVIPSESPDLKAKLGGKVRVVEFGNVLDGPSLRMVSEVVRDMQKAKRDK